MRFFNFKGQYFKYKIRYRSIHIEYVQCLKSQTKALKKIGKINIS
jgi:hypothetical protein